MKKNTLLLFLSLFFFSSFSPLNAQGFLHRSGKYIYDANGNEVLLRGIGTGNWLLQEGYMMKSENVAGTHTQFRNKLIETIGIANTDIFYAHWLDQHFTRRDVDSMKQWGFNSVRVAMHYKWFTLPIEDEPIVGQDTWFENGFVRIDSLLDWCRDNQMYLILDLHAAPGGQGHDANISDYDPTKPSLWESAENRRKTVALWKKLAQRYVNEPWIGGYDLINEPNWELPNGTLLKQIYVNITNAIREVDQNHIIIIEGNWFANDYTGLTPPWDDNMVYSFHKYWNYNTLESIQWMINMRNSYNIPIWLGETGENSNSWFTSLIALAEQNKIGWSWWPVKKAGINNVLMVPESASYNNLVSYWKTGSPSMTSDQAFAAVLDWANNHKIENCIVQRDVIDAMIRQPHTDATLPFVDHDVKNAIHLSDYDLGKCSFAYWDADTANYHLNTNSFTNWNAGWSYRNDGVDIERCYDSHPDNNGYSIGWVNANEWLQFTIHSDSAAAYQVMFRSASATGPAIVRLEVNGTDISPAHQLPATGGWQTWSNSTINNVILPGGTNKVRLVFGKAGSNVSFFKFTNPQAVSTVSFGFVSGESVKNNPSLLLTLNKPVTELSATPADFIFKVNGVETPIQSIELHPDNNQKLIIHLENELSFNQTVLLSYTGSSITSDGQILDPFVNKSIKNTLPRRFVLPIKIQAEDFDVNSGFQLEDCTDIGGGKNLGYANNGDYVEYYVSIAEAGDYNFQFRVASLYSNGRVSVQLGNGSSFTPIQTVAFTATGGWQSWKTQSFKMSLPKGNFNLRLYSVAGEYNLNWMDISRFTSTTELTDLRQFKIYPNPSTGAFFVEATFEQHKEIKVQIINVFGQEVYSKQWENALTLNETISCEQCTSGTYFIRLSTREGQIVRKIVFNKASI